MGGNGGKSRLFILGDRHINKAVHAQGDERRVASKKERRSVFR